jgi:hypothetical protein
MNARTALLVLFCLSLGCDPKDGSDANAQFEDIVRTRASDEFSCAQDQISIQDLDGYAYRATGCGEYAEYECGYSFASGNSGCGSNKWLYVCDRAAQDTPEHVGGDAGKD